MNRERQRSFMIRAVIFWTAMALLAMLATQHARASTCNRPPPTEHQHELLCLAAAVYYEARSQDEIGQELVAWVVINRTNSANWPSTICEVVWQPSQFGWTNGSVCLSPNINSKAWERAVLVARRVMSRQHRPRVTATYFMNPDSSDPAAREWFYRELIPLFGYDDEQGRAHHFFRHPDDPATLGSLIAMHEDRQ